MNYSNYYLNQSNYIRASNYNKQIMQNSSKFINTK